ncbi:MAG: sigma 54-interacting transcriptional regulator [bacterium]
MEKIYLFAFEAPLFYRLGRFDEAIRAYDLWFQEIDPTPHNLTLVQTVKYHLYTGLVNFTAGRETASRERLEECLKTGDHDQHPRLRLYHVRAHSLLAALDEKEEKLESARSHLEAALALATEDPLLKSEIEQRLGALDQLTLRYEEAMAHFENALALSREAKSPQAQAIAHHSIALLHRECGKPLKALEVMEEALQWAQKGSDLLQQSRYCENKALIEMDLGRYAKAFSIMEEVQDILEQYGEDRDHFLMKIHRATLALFTGNWDRAEKIIAQAEKDPASRKESLSPSLLLLKAERSYLALRYAETAPLFRKLLRELKPGAMNFDFLTAQIGLLRCLSRSGKLEKSEWIHAALLCRMETLQDTAFSIWRKTFSLLSLPPEESLREADFLDLLQSIQKVELPEMRIDLYGLVSLDLKRRNLTALAERLWQACRQELENLHQLLPEELKMDFEKNRDLKSLDQTLNDLLPTSKEEIPPSKQTEAPGARPASQGRISEIRFRQYSEINRQISQKTDLNEILERVMDAAIEITGAERGFLLLKNGTGKNSLSDFQVKTARHFNHRSLEENEFQFSMSAVEEAVKQGTYLLTDNAQYDPRLQEKKSVVKFSLKSILVVPLELEGEVLGAIYLDHRYQPDCFSEEDVVLLTAFASQGALAIQKAQMMEELRAAKAKLEEQVENQAQRIEVLSTELSQVRDQLRYGYEEIVGQSPGMMKVFQLLDHVTETTIPVWILGESGTGKELIARSLHFNSPRDKGPFVTENVSAIPETLLESELFGHKKGAFTHADRDRVGLFEQAHNGTLFLDEIADMSLAMQAKLLRVLQEGEIRPLGSSKKIKVDVRLVTASNRDLNQMVKDEKFRQDLFFRINGLTIKLPALRERKDDIPLLVDYLVKKIAKGFNLQPSEVSDEALQIFLRYEWPGNIRELEGTLRNALLFAKGRPITKEVLSTQENLFKTGQSMGRESSRKIEGVSAEENSSERQIILDALRRHNMDKEAVAEELDISLRNLYTRMERHNIPKKKTVLSKYLGLK